MRAKLRLLVQAGLSLLPGFIKLPLYRLLFGARIGAGVRVGFAAIITFDELTLEAGARIGAFNLLRVSRLTLGKRARIGSRVRVDCHTLAMGSASTISSFVDIMADHRDPRSVFEMGSESWVLEYCFVNPARAIRLGRNVGVGGGSYLFAHGLWLCQLEGYPVAFGPIVIGDDVWLPWGCFIMPGVEIGSGAVVGARSLVTKSIPAGALAAGTPAKVIRDQVAVAPTLAERNRMLLSATEEFATYVGGKLAVEESGGFIRCRLDDEPLFVLATEPGVVTPPQPLGAEMCLVHTRYAEMEHRHPRVYSLVSYQSCPYGSVGPAQRRWLAHLRLIGLRYYPVDEVQVEG